MAAAPEPSGGERTPERVLLGVLVALVAGALLVGDGGDDGGAKGARSGAAAAARLPAVGVVARRVERIRGLRFERRPTARLVTPAQARREGLRELSRAVSPARVEAEGEALELLGLLPPGTDLRAVEEKVLQGEVAGYYNPRIPGRVSVVRGRAGGTLGEVTLAHELVHALEDQRYGLREPESGLDDRTLAYQALAEGTATAAMTAYATRHVSAGDLFVDALATGSAGEDLPPYVQATLEFPYLAGQDFVEALRRPVRSWRLVDNALRRRPPSSTEQVLHPEKWLSAEEPVAVRLGAAPVLRRAGGWRRLVTGGFGEWDTRQLLARGDPSRSDAAAEGWGGGRYELWRRGPGRCGPPCREREALVVGWEWDTGSEARELVGALPEAVRAGLRARRLPSVSPGEWVVGRGFAAMRARGRRVALALAPTRVLAALLASAATAGHGRPGR